MGPFFIWLLFYVFAFEQGLTEELVRNYKTPD